MSFFKPKSPFVPNTKSSDSKPFIPAASSLAKLRTNTGEGETIQTSGTFFNTEPFFKPQAKLRNPPVSKPNPEAEKGASEGKETSNEQLQLKEQDSNSELSAPKRISENTLEVDEKNLPDSEVNELRFIFDDVERTISISGTVLTMKSFSLGDLTAFEDKDGGEGNPQISYNGDSISFKLMLIRIMNPQVGDSFSVDFVLNDGTVPLTVTYTMGEVKNNGENKGWEESAKVEGQSDGATEATSNPTEQSSGTYWTHDWHIDRFGNEALFIWEVGGKRSYSNANRGYAYIREKAALLPSDSGYDPRFERFKHRPQTGEGSNSTLNWWIKRTPGWDNPNHVDNGTADFSDLAEFKDSADNRKGTGFYYMGFVFDPLIYEKLAEQKTDRANQKYIGNRTSYRGYVLAEAGIILHDTPSPFDESYHTKRKGETPSDFTIEFNEPIRVIAEGNKENEGWLLIENSIGEKGWIEGVYISKKTDIASDSNFDSYTVKEGDTLEGLIKSNYKDYPHSTGNDRRTIALAIYLYNEGITGSGVTRNPDKYKNAASWKDVYDPWMQETRANYQSIELLTGGEVKLPPAAYIEKMRRLGQLEKRPDFANIIVEGGRLQQGFIAGVGIGFWDSIVGAGEDLYNMFADIFSGEIFNQIADMFTMLWEKGFEGIWEMIKEFGIGTWEEMKAAWDNPNAYQRGEYFGEIIGMILFEIVLALLTYGVGAAVRNSARVTKIIKWFPSINKKSVVPHDVDNYADDIRRMNGDRDADFDRNKNDSDRDNDHESDKESEGDNAENAKALIAAKAYVDAQDALDPSPEVRLVVSAINKMAGTKLSGGKRYKAKPNGMGEGHFEIYYNPKVTNDYTEGKFGIEDRAFNPRKDERFDELSKEEGKNRPSDKLKGEKEAEGILKAEQNGLVENPRRPKSGDPDLDFAVDGPPPYKWCDIKSPVSPDLRPIELQVSDIAQNIIGQKAGSDDVLHVINLNQIPVENRAEFMKSIITRVGSAEGIAFVD